MRILNDQAIMPLRLPTNTRIVNILNKPHMDWRVVGGMNHSRMKRLADKMVVKENAAMTAPYEP